MYIVYGLDTTEFRDRRIPLFLKAVKINKPLKPLLSLTFDVQLLEDILQIIKWSKTMQDLCKTTSITIPALGASPLCLVAASTAMFNRFTA